MEGTKNEQTKGPKDTDWGDRGDIAHMHRWGAVTRSSNKGQYMAKGVCLTVE